MPQPLDSTNTRRDPAGTIYTPPNPTGPVASGTAITIHGPNGPVPGHMNGTEAVPDKLPPKK